MSVQNVSTVWCVSFLERIIQEEKVTSVHIKTPQGRGKISLDDDYCRKHFIKIFRQTMLIVHPHDPNDCTPYYVRIKAYVGDNLKVNALWKMVTVQKLYGEYEAPIKTNLIHQSETDGDTYVFE